MSRSPPRTPDLDTRSGISTKAAPDLQLIEEPQSGRIQIRSPQMPIPMRDPLRRHDGETVDSDFLLLGPTWTFTWAPSYEETLALADEIDRRLDSSRRSHRTGR